MYESTYYSADVLLEPLKLARYEYALRHPRALTFRELVSAMRPFYEYGALDRFRLYRDALRHRLHRVARF